MLDLVRRAIDYAFPARNAKRRQFELDLSRSKILPRGSDIMIIMSDAYLAAAWQETAGLSLERALVAIIGEPIDIVFTTEAEYAKA